MIDDMLTAGESKKMKDLLLAAPDSQIDASLKPIIEKWSDPPTALQALEVLDKAVFGALASGIAMTFLQTVYSGALVKENKTHAEVAEEAPWRKQDGW